MRRKLKKVRQKMDTADRSLAERPWMGRKPVDNAVTRNASRLKPLVEAVESIGERSSP